MYSQEHTRKWRGASCWPNAIKDIWGLVSRCYYTGKEMLAVQQTETTKIYSIPRRFLKEPGKDIFITSHTNYLIIADKCSDCEVVVELPDGKQASKGAFQQASCLIWSNFAWLTQEEKSCPSILPPKHDQTAKLNQWFYLLNWCWRRQRLLRLVAVLETGTQLNTPKVTCQQPTFIDGHPFNRGFKFPVLEHLIGQVKRFQHRPAHWPTRYLHSALNGIGCSPLFEFKSNLPLSYPGTCLLIVFNELGSLKLS